MVSRLATLLVENPAGTWYVCPYSSLQILPYTAVRANRPASDKPAKITPAAAVQSIAAAGDDLPQLVDRRELTRAP